jgi:hypothetical protein
VTILQIDIDGILAVPAERDPPITRSINGIAEMSTTG